MKLAEDGIPTIAFLVIVTLVFFWIALLPGLILAVLTGFVIWFYRDPERSRPVEDGLLTSPADGRVVEIEPTEHPFTGPCVKVGIFMNVFSVHVNRTPCDGVVEYLKYVPGKKLAAFAPKASEVNERHYVGLSTPFGPVLLVQIAGLLARRIVCRLALGESLAAGERFGMIRLGSKVDIYLPKGVQLSVKVGDKVYAGQSQLGVMWK
ncbi:MAG: phosphatidylserine decarboxylase family protein [Fretibacterium sp.]|nr:phosphatidylserine decarboxylase family protein [Fretibacterium sp.]